MEILERMFTLIFVTLHRFPSQLMNRQSLSGWRLSGLKPMRERVNEWVKEILSAHQGPPLMGKVEKTIEKIFRKYGETT